MKTICVMQPYVFPYLPYFQLADAVDEFWILDDVQYIRRGWMARNSILLSGQKHQIVFPVGRGQQSDLISNKALPGDFEKHLQRIIATLIHAYGKAPQAEQIRHLLGSLADLRRTRYLDFALETLQLSFEHLRVTTPMHLTSALSLPPSMRGADRILEICARVGAARYVNPSGGMALYNPKSFAVRGIELRFLKGQLPPYPQIGCDAFVPSLSILDLIAHLNPNALSVQVKSYVEVSSAEGEP